MNTTADKLNGLKNTKAAIKQAIIDKGVALANEPFSAYAGKIGEIQAGGGAQGIPKVICYDSYHGDNYNDEWSQQIKSLDWTGSEKWNRTNFSKLFSNFGGDDCGAQTLSTKGATNMNEMFAFCNVSHLDLSKFDTSKVTSMSGMFKNMSEMRNSDLDLRSFDTSKVTFMGYMFESLQCQTLDISSFDTTKVTNNYCMFNYFGGKNVIWPDNFMPNSAITSIDLTGPSYDPIKLPKESLVALINKLSTRTNSPTLVLNSKLYALLTPEEIAIAQDKGWTVTGA